MISVFTSTWLSIDFLARKMTIAFVALIFYAKVQLGIDRRYETYFCLSLRYG